MNERMRESLSALMDDEANELELERVLSQLGGDDELRQAWSRYNLGRSAIHGEQLAHLDWDISRRVQSALSGSESGIPAVEDEGFRHRLLRPLISVGVAASVALTVVVGGQQLARIDGSTAPYDDQQSLAASPSPVNGFGGFTLPASWNGSQAMPQLLPATRTAYQDLARQRQQLYMQQHAEQAALNSPQGLVPFARVPEIRE
jgi:sigma-E factor negative regulatory protein RseA